MTLRVYSSVTYIVCVLDSEGQRMGLESLLIVEHFLFPYLHKGMTMQCSTYLWHAIQILHILGGRSAETWTAVSASVSRFAGGDQRGGAPPRQTLQNAPLSFTSQPNLNLTMEPAQYACNPIHGLGSAELPEYLLLAQKKLFSVW